MADELGTIEVGHLDSRFREELHKPDDVTRSPVISVRCGFGRLVASVTGDAGIYDDLSIDLLTDDGRHLQIVTVSCDEAVYDDENDEPGICVLVWNGVDEDPAHSRPIHVSDKHSRWY